MQRQPGLDNDSSPVADTHENTFEVIIGKMRHIFAKYIDYSQFNNAVESVLIVEYHQMQCYRILSGSKSAREWKPWEYSNQLVRIILNYADGGIEVGVVDKVPT